MLSFLYFHWLFPLSARETSPVNPSIYKSTRERIDCKGLYGRCRLHLMTTQRVHQSTEYVVVRTTNFLLVNCRPEQIFSQWVILTRMLTPFLVFIRSTWISWMFIQFQETNNDKRYNNITCRSALLLIISKCNNKAIIVDL